MTDRQPIAARAIGWAAARCFGFVALVVLCTVAADGLIGGALVWLAGRTGQRLRVDAVIQLAGILAATAIMLRSVDHRPWRDVGLDAHAAAPRRLGEGVLAGGLTSVAVCALLLALGGLELVAGEPGGSFGAALRISVVLVPAALAEEVLCRGYLLTVAGEAAGRWSAIIVTSVAFGAMHLANPGATPTSVSVVVLSGVFLALVRFATGSLYAAWMAHLAWNWMLAVAFHATVSGLRFEAPDYRSVTTGPAWFSGGSWGPEGGAAAALGMMAAAIFYARRRREES